WSSDVCSSDLQRGGGGRRRGPLCPGTGGGGPVTHVLVLAPPDEPQLPGLEALPDAVTVARVSGEDELRARLPDTDVLVVSDFRSQLLQKCWPARHRIRWVHATSAGVDALMFPALWDSATPVTNARGIFDRALRSEE